MLPTNEKAKGFIYKHIDKSLTKSNNLVNQHLYILSDDEIKEGDWYLCTRNNLAFPASKFHKQLPTDRKIIATTDKFLKIECQGCRFHRNSNDVIYTCSCQQLPQPSQAFIEKYIEEYNKGNVIEEVMVEYEFPPFAGIEMLPQQLKISKDNTITIRRIKDSWSKEEILDKIKELSNQSFTTWKERFDWLEENL